MDALTVLGTEEVSKAVAKMSDEERDYLKLLISHLVRGFSDEDYRCVLAVRQHSKESVAICSINASEEMVVEIMTHACDVLSFADTVGVPPKGEFH